MFESIAVSVLNSVLGKYIKDLDSSQLRLGILKGRAVLTDLELRPDALDGFHLPVEVICGYVGKISLLIPWANPFSEPYEITVHDVYLIAGPVRDRKYDHERAKASEIEAKRKRLAQIVKRMHPTEASKTEEKPADEEDGSDSFVDKLAAQVVKNLKISVRNIHFRYEDKVTSPANPFAVGFTLQNLSAETTNEFWQEAVVNASAKTVYKIVSLDCLSVYWNTNQKSSSFYGTQKSWKRLMSQGVSSKASTPSDFEFILKPLSAECHVIMDQSSEIVLDTPKLLIEVLQQELSLMLSQNQFHNLVDMFESFELMAINQMYRKYQPTSPIEANPRAWWKYAYTAICEEKIRSWTWARMKEHRIKYKLYKELWIEKLKGFGEDERERKLVTIQSLEDTLDIPSILIARKHAELQVPPKERFRPGHERQSSSWLSWFGFGSESSESSSYREGAMHKLKEGEEDIWSMLSGASLTAEEKEKLYKAIDYDENVRVKYPVEYIKSRVTFNLDRCTFVLLDAKNKEIAQLDTEGFDSRLEQRPAQSAFRFHGKVNRFKMLGYSEDKENQLSLLSSKTSASEGTPLVDCVLETKPLQLSADYAVKLKVEPIEVHYDSTTIDKIVSFFSMPESSKLKELEIAAANRFQELRKWTRAGLVYAITQHEVTYLDIDVRSPFIVIPEYGTLQREGAILAVDLGHFKVVSSLAPRDASVDKLSDHELEEMFYDKFEMTLDDVQVMLIDKGMNWKPTLGSPAASPYHILPSTALTIQFQKSITFDNVELPEFKVASVLPSLHFKFSDAKLQTLMMFVDHFPVGVTEPSPLEEKERDVGPKKWRSSASTLSLEEAEDLQAVVNDAFASRLQGTESEEDDVWYDAEENPSEESHGEKRPANKTAQNVTRMKLSGTFTIGQLLVTVNKANEQSINDTDLPYLSLEIKDLRTDVAVFSWHLQAQMKLGFIQLLDHHWKDVDGSNLCVLSSSAVQDWITVNYIKADPAGPEFKTKFHSTEQFLEVRFSSLRLTAKQEAIASFQIFVLSLFQSVGREPDWKAVPQRLLETITEEDQVETSPVIAKEGKLPSNSEVVSFKIAALIEEVTVILSSRDQYVGKIEVQDLDVTVDVIPSETIITTKLKDFKISDLREGTLYPNIVDLTDNTVFDCKVTIFNKSAQGAIADQDPTALDFSVDLKLGKLRFVFLEYFVAHLQHFIQAIVSPETVAYAQNVTQKMVLNQVQYIQTQGAKIGLRISVNAPQIRIPCNSKSQEMLVADLGQLHISNSIKSSSQYGLIDTMDVSLSSFQVSGLSQVEKHLSHYLIEPVQLNVVVKRRLNTEASDLPLIEVIGNLALFKINLGISDFRMLMMVINDNLLEGRGERQGAPESSEPLPPDEDLKSITAESLDRTDAGSVISEKEETSVKCTFTLGKVQVNSPKVVDGIIKPYLILEAKDMRATVTIDKWLLAASAKLGAIEMLDNLNTGCDGSPVKFLSSSRDDDLISVSYESVDPKCPQFESAFNSIEQHINILFSKLKIDCLQKSLMDLQMHGLALIDCLRGTDVTPTPTSNQESLSTEKSGDDTVSLKVETTLSEIEVLIRVSEKNLAEVKIQGLMAEFHLLKSGLLLKSRQKGLSVVDLDSTSYYPEIIAVENENVFDFEFKYFNNVKQSEGEAKSHAELTELDGNLKLHLGRIKIVFLYKFIAQLWKFVEPLTSPQSTQYVQETAQRAVTERIGSLQSEGTRIGLQITISAPLVIIPRHSRSVDMLVVNLGLLDIQNEFDILPLPQESGGMEAVFDIIELSLQSVQLSRGVLDLSSSSVIKRLLIEPIKLDAHVKRSLLPPGHNVPILECTATLGIVKMNLGQQDYHVLTTLFQENLKEADESGELQEPHQPLGGVSMKIEAEHMESPPIGGLSADLDQAEEASVWDRMVFSFDFVGASLTLYSNERTLNPLNPQSYQFDPAKKLCLFEVDKSMVTIVLPSDSSVQIHCLLNGCVVEDIRKGITSEFPRLIDKRMARNPDGRKLQSSDEMCDVVFSLSASGEMNVDITLQNAAIFVNFPFLFPLLDFFVSPPQGASENVRRIATASQTDALAGYVSVFEVEGPYLPHTEERLLDAVDFISEVDAAMLEDPSGMKIKARCVVKEPEIFFLSDATKKDSEALIVQAEVELDYSMKEGKQILSAKLTELQMQASQFPDVEKTSYKVLNPCSMTFSYSAPASDKGGQDIAIYLEAMRFHFSPGLLATVSNVIKELTGQREVGVAVQTVGHEVIAAPSDLWDAKPASADYWYKKKAVEDSKPKLVKRKTTEDKLVVTAKDVRVVLVNEIEGAHVPLLLVQSSMEAQASDWSAQLKVESDIAVQISFYNESLAAWEPLLEPITEGQETTMWEVQIKVFLAEGYVSNFSPQDVSKPCDGPPTDTLDGTVMTPVAQDEAESSFRSLTQRKSSFRKLSLRRQSAEKPIQVSMGRKSDHEDDLDYEGAVAMFIQSTGRVFSESSSDDDGFDVADAPKDEVDAGPEATTSQSQATYIVINSHDVLQLTVTPTALEVLTELSQLWTTERTKKPRTVPGPTFLLRNELGIHAEVTVSPTHQISDSDQLTVKRRASKQPSAKLMSLAGAGVGLSHDTHGVSVKQQISHKSDPFFSRLRDKLHKIRRKRTDSEPVSLAEIRRRKFSLQVTPALQAAGHGLASKARNSRGRLSSDPEIFTNKGTISTSLPALAVGGTDADHKAQGDGSVERVRERALFASPPPEERIEDSRATTDGTFAGIEDSRLGKTVANIGVFAGGIVAPHQGNRASGWLQRKQVEPDDTDDNDNTLSLTVDGFDYLAVISIARSGSFLYELSPCDAALREENHKWYIVIQVEIKNGHKTVTLRSPLQIQNHLQVAVDVFVKRKLSSASTEKISSKLFTVEPGGAQNVPLQVAYKEEIFVKPSDTNFDLAATALSWRKFSEEDPSCILACPPVKDSTTPDTFYIKALFQTDCLNKLPSGDDSPHHVIHLHPPLVIQNKLPVDLELSAMAQSKDVDLLHPGEKLSIVSMCPGDNCQVKIVMKNYEDLNWIGHMVIRKETDKSLSLLMKSQEETPKELFLGVLTLHQSGTREMFIYSPYWLINKTGLHVEYRVSKTKQVYVQSAVDKHPLLFNFTETTYRKAKLRLLGHPWSSKFSLDAVGDSGKVTCKTNDGKKFEFILQIELSRTGLTKLVTLTPKYVIINNTEISLSFIENRCKNSLWFVVEPGECKPFWPIDRSGVIVVKPTMSKVISKPFGYSLSHTTVLRISDLRALSVDVHGEVEDSVTTIVVSAYTPGIGTVRIENLCENTAIRFQQKNNGQVTVLNSDQKILYTWDDPQGDRKLLWKPYMAKNKSIEVPVDKDDSGKVRVELDENSPPVKDERKDLENKDTTCGLICGSSAGRESDVMDHGVWTDSVDGPKHRVKKTIYWVSVMDGLQRVIIFTDRENLSSLVRKCCDFEIVNIALFLSLDGVGLSLVNSKPDEVAYIRLSCSTSIWQVERSPGKWKSLNLELQTWLEDAWRNKDGVLDLEDRMVDFDTMTMIRPHRGAIRRLFEPAVWFNYTSSDHYHSLYFKSYKLQIDNQQIGAVFPVALYPAAIPQSVIRNSGFKPFIEMSLIYHEDPKEDMHHIKYAKALVQEMNVKIDIAFIISLVRLFSQEKKQLVEESYFAEDMEKVAVTLKETEAVKAALQTQRQVFLEYFHLSPLKINLSFSLASSWDDTDDDQAFTHELWDFFIDSVGATLTDINDAELRLAYFERVSVFVTEENLVAQIRSHYTMQAVRQFYVLVLGLDVLGNPYALVHGIKEGVKDFFYEPYQGIVAGPVGFAQGFARGVQSLLGHVIGDTAGSFSRITGSLGQAVATLTFDSNFQMRRRLRMQQRPHGIGQGLIKGGTSLLMGLYFGLSGVVVKPVKGARSEGVEGFFKGIGKGLLGLLAHPTGGVIDMVSFTLDGVRRSAELTGEDIVVRRLPRFTAPNMPLKPYSEHDAEGFAILKSLNHVDDVYVDHVTVTNEESSFVVLLTDRRILNLYKSKFWLGWKVRWSCQYEDIVGVPCLTANALVIQRENKDDPASISLALPVCEIVSSDESILESLKSKIENALRHYR